jgi:hypothetical protein
MAVKDPELDALFHETALQVSQDNYQPDADSSSLQRFTRAHDAGLTVTLRVKPDRRLVVTCVPAEFERRSRA